MPAEGEKGAESADDWLIQSTDQPHTETEPQGTVEEFTPGKGTLQPPDESIGPETEQWLVPAEAGRNGHADPPAVPVAEDRIKDLERRVRDESARAEREAKRADEEATRAKAASGSGKRADAKRLEQATQSLAEQREVNSDLAKRLRDLQTVMRLQAKEAKSELAHALKERDAEAQRQISERDAEAQKLIKDAEAAAEKRVAQVQADLSEQLKAREGELNGRIEELEVALAREKKRSKAGKAATTSRPRGKSSGRAGKSATSKGTGTRNGKLELNDAKFEDLRDLGLTVTQSARVIAYRDVGGGYDSLDELESIPGLSRETLADLRTRLTVSS